MPAGVFLQCLVELGFAEIRPERLGDDKFGVGDLPEQEIADAHFAAGSDDEVRVRDIAGVEVLGEQMLVDLLGFQNAALDLMRRRATREKSAVQLGEELGCLFAPADDPDEQVFREALAAALEGLPPDQRVVVHLKLWEDLTFEVIADMLEIPLNTAASRYRYGIDKLRQKLRPLYDELNRY